MCSSDLALGQRGHPEARSVAEQRTSQSTTDPSVRLHAANALGRVGNAVSVPALLEALESPDLFLRHAAFNALREIGMRHPEAWLPIVAALGHSSPRVAGNVAHALRDAYSPQLVRALAGMVADDSQPLRIRTEIGRAHV